MKNRKLILALICAAALSQAGCATIDEDRYASVPCADLKKLIGQNQLADLVSTADTRFPGLDPEPSRKNILSLSDNEVHSAELRAAYNKMCK